MSGRHLIATRSVASHAGTLHATAGRQHVAHRLAPYVNHVCSELLTHVRSVNKTDVLTLLSQFESVAGILSVSHYGSSRGLTRDTATPDQYGTRSPACPC